MPNKPRELPECPDYMAHPQSVWFECHWRPKFTDLQEQYDELRELNRKQCNHAQNLQAHCDSLAESLEWLLKLKTWKDLGRNTEIYERDNPKAWLAAQKALFEHQEGKSDE